MSIIKYATISEAILGLKEMVGHVLVVSASFRISKHLVSQAGAQSRATPVPVSTFLKNYCETPSTVVVLTDSMDSEYMAALEELHQ